MALRRRGRLDRGLRLLVVLTVAIGVGSSLFHTVADRRTLLADLIPILLFQLALLTLYLRRVAGLGRSSILLLVGLFLAASLICRSFPTLLNGSLSYAPALLALLVMGLHFRRVASGEPWLLLVAAALFAVSHSLCSVDLVLCPLLPLGTHLFWHLLNSLVLVLAARSLLIGPAPLLDCDRPPGQTGPQAWRP
jgi:hypothetical protein